MEIFLLIGSVLLLFLSGFDYFRRGSQISILEIQKIPMVTEAHRISSLIRSGGFACLRSQHAFLLLALPVVAFLLKRFSNEFIMFGFIAGFLLCLILIYFSFATATIGNLETAFECMKSNGLQQGFVAARRAGNIISLFISGAMLLLLFVSRINAHGHDLIVGCAFGVSLVTIFTRLAGGIFTKSADIGGDLVGKIHADLPEDSPKNPAVIADNIGDNIGDCIGTAADILETFGIFLVAFITCVSTERMHVLLAFLGSYLASILAITITKTHLLESTKKGVMDSIAKVFRNALFLAPLVFVLLLLVFNMINKAHAISWSVVSLKQFACFSLGILTALNTLFFNWYYTGDAAPVRKIVDATKKGAAMNLITGYFLGLESAFAIILSSSLIVALTFILMGSTGVFICTACALGFIPCIMSMDAYGPIVDNAGGICVMSGAPELARKSTDILDSLGNTMKALTKGYTGCMTFISSALLLSSIMSMVKLNLDMMFLLTILLGVGSIFMFSSLVMRGVFSGADYMVKVTLMKMKNESPDSSAYYMQPIKFLSRKSVQYSVLPIISCIGPIFLLWMFKSTLPNSSIIGFLIGIVCGVPLSIKMTNAGGALDNAKKTIESEIGGQIKKAEAELSASLSEFESSNNKQAKPIHELLEEISSSLSGIQKNTDIDNDEITFLIRKLKNQVGVIKMERKLAGTLQMDLSQGISVILGKAEIAQNPIFAKLKLLMDLKVIKNSSVIGDTVGDPLKDAAGVSINNMIKLSTILSILLFQWI